MRVLRGWIHRLRGTLQGVRRAADLEEELRLHMELARKHVFIESAGLKDVINASRQGQLAMRDVIGLHLLPRAVIADRSAASSSRPKPPEPALTCRACPHTICL
jgi:hypothetical protein